MFHCCFLTWPNASVRVAGSESGQGGVGGQILDGASHINAVRQVTVVPKGLVATLVLTGTSPTTKNVQEKEIASVDGAGNKTEFINLFPNMTEIQSFNIASKTNKCLGTNSLKYKYLLPLRKKRITK